MKSIKEIETLLELTKNEVPVNYNSLINTFKNSRFKITYENKQYIRRVINCHGIYTTMLEVCTNETDEKIVMLMIHYNNPDYIHDVDVKRDLVLIVYMRRGPETLFDNSKYISC